MPLKKIEIYILNFDITIPKFKLRMNKIIAFYVGNEINFDKIKFLNYEPSDLMSIFQDDGKRKEFINCVMENNLGDTSRIAFRTNEILIHSLGANNNNDVDYPFTLLLDPQQDECICLEKFLHKLDDYFGSTEVKEKLFGDFDLRKCTYVPCVSYYDKNWINRRSVYGHVQTDTGICHFRYLGSKGRKHINFVTDETKKVLTGSNKEIFDEIQLPCTLKLIFMIDSVWINYPNYGVDLLIAQINYKKYEMPKLELEASLTDDIDFLSSEDEENEEDELLSCSDEENDEDD